ncbi:MAG: hypothetical protein C4560_03490 [Nitrospiraceae bacterium]|nr:MAG: hypothetical protein C4560_03490 [Nitrospiraceae bacterium]
MQNKGGNSSFVKRHIVAAAVLPLFIAYIYYLPPLPYFLALLTLAAMYAMWEFYVMYKVPAGLYVPGVLIGGALFFISCLYPEYYVDGIFAGLFILLTLRLFLASTPAGCMSEIGPVGVGFFYIAGFLKFQWLLRSGDLGLQYIFLLFLSGWLSDSMAYYIGTYLGRHKLYPAISPNKTWEGALGSVIGGALGAVIAITVFDIPTLSIKGAIAAGSVLGIAALTGDLIESMFKRDAGVKDSSRLLPSHGGILDKLDGLLIAGPVLYLIVRHF